MSFDYETENNLLNTLHSTNWAEWNKKRTEFFELTKFNFDSILPELENYLSNRNHENWIVQKTLIFNETTNEADICYYALNKKFLCLVDYANLTVGKESYIKQQNMVKQLNEENELFTIGTLNKKFDSKRDAINYYIASNEKRNYMSEEFFNIPEGYYDLYNIIIKYINVGATNKLVQKQKVHA